MNFARFGALACVVVCSCGGAEAGDEAETGEVKEALTVFTDGFETGALGAQWSASGQAAVTTAAGRTGVYGVRLTGTATLTLSFDTFGLGDPTISYGRRAAHLDSGESLTVDWRRHGESTWQTLQSVGNSAWTTSTFTLTGAADTSVTVRFRTNANAPPDERADLDNVTITADPLPTCTDGVKNGAETDIDCGGGSCGPCNVGQACGAARDCTSATCASQICRAAQTNQRVAVLLFDYLGDGLQQSPQVIRDAVFTQSNSIARFYQEVSYGKVNLIGDVYGWYRPSQPLSGEGWTNCWPTDTALFEEVASTVTLANYDKFLLVVHDVEKPACVAGNSTYGPLTYLTPQGQISATLSRLRGPFYPGSDFSGTTQSSVAHEFGHSFGVDHHANSYLCTGSPLTQTVSACNIGAYGDLFDRMGMGNQATYFNTAIKQGLGWLPASNAKTVTTSGTFSILRQEVQQTGTQLLRIPLRAPVQMHTADNSNDVYMQELLVEYRGMTGFDTRSTFYRTIPLQNGGSFLISNTQGALVRGASCKGGLCPSYLLDMHPQAFVPVWAPNEVADAYLYPNETFAVPGNAISIQTLSADANAVTVRVDISNLCGNGVLDPGERCDSGAGNSTALGACRPDCQGPVHERRIFRSSTRILPNFGGVTGADAACRAEFGTGYRALITDGVRRVASVSANRGDGQIDWVLQPYTRYVNASNALVWTTDAAALLGVTNGAHQALLAPPAGDDGWGAWGGFRNDWTSNPSTCSGWTSSSASVSGAGIIVNATSAAQFPNNNTASPCSATRRLLCVQSP